MTERDALYKEQIVKSRETATNHTNSGDKLLRTSQYESNDFFIVIMDKTRLFFV